MGGANGVFPPAGHAIPGQAITLEAALDNLALAASMDSAILQQLMVANLALTTTNALLTATNKTLVESATKARAAAHAGGMTVGTSRTAGRVERLQSQTATVGRMVTKSMATTLVKPVLPKWKVIALSLHTTTPWVGVKRTWFGRVHPPDRGG